MTKLVASTIQRLATSDALQIVLDRTRPVPENLITKTLDHWRYDLYSRRPGPALLGADGGLKPTDLDLACFMSALVDRRAVINLPSYQSRRPTTLRAGEHVVSKHNRHGNVVGMTAHKEVFSFSARIFDQNVIVQTPSGDKTGAFRNFMLVDIDGAWHDGWKTIEFLPTAKENDFLADKKLWTGNSVVFSNFVHPNRWVSMFGQYYLFTKLLTERLTEEAAHLNVMIRAMQAEGIVASESAVSNVPRPEEFVSGETMGVTRAEGVAEKVAAFQVEVDAPWSGTFPVRSLNTAHDAPSLSRQLFGLKAEWSHLVYKVCPELRFATRATELAFYRRATGSGTLEPSHPAAAGFPAWISGAQWVGGYREEGKRTDWYRLTLAQSFPGVMGLALRCRTYLKTERVAG